MRPLSLLVILLAVVGCDGEADPASAEAAGAGEPRDWAPVALTEGLLDSLGASQPAVVAWEDSWFVAWGQRDTVAGEIRVVEVRGDEVFPLAVPGPGTAPRLFVDWQGPKLAYVDPVGAEDYDGETTIVIVDLAVAGSEPEEPLFISFTLSADRTAVAPVRGGFVAAGCRMGPVDSFVAVPIAWDGTVGAEVATEVPECAGLDGSAEVLGDAFFVMEYGASLVRLAPDDLTFSPPLFFGEEEGTAASSPKLLAAGANLAVVWRAGNGGPIRARLLDADEMILGDSVLVETTGDEEPTLYDAAADEDAIHIAWSSYMPSDNVMGYGQRVQMATVRDGSVEGIRDMGPGAYAAIALGPEHPDGREIGVVAADIEGLVLTRFALPAP